VADEVVIVEDGPLADAHYVVIDAFKNGSRAVQRVVRSMNGGAGLANQAGLERASGEWIAKADADDINLSERFERQLAFVTEHGVDVLGAAMFEFTEDPSQSSVIRRMPERHSKIARTMKMNSPINHPTSFYRRELALAVGGYSDLRFMQDYDLFARMLAGGARFANDPKPLVGFRADQGMYSRRTSREMTRCEWRLQHNLRDYGVVGPGRMWTNLALRLTFRRLPDRALKLAYRALFHTQITDAS
jgi:glycosyltransferase involved in cell wall biosynthesis